MILPIFFVSGCPTEKGLSALVMSTSMKRNATTPLDVGVQQRIDKIIPVIEITEVIEQVDAIADTFRAPNTIHPEDTPKQEKDADKFASQEPQGIQQLLTPEPTPTPVSSSPMPVSAPTEDIPSLPDRFSTWRTPEHFT